MVTVGEGRKWSFQTVKKGEGRYVTVERLLIICFDNDIPADIYLFKVCTVIFLKSVTNNSKKLSILA